MYFGLHEKYAPQVRSRNVSFGLQIPFFYRAQVNTTLWIFTYVLDIRIYMYDFSIFKLKMKLTDFF
jgi:hypothetical protein